MTIDTPKNLNAVMDKISDLKSLFVFGEKLLPILQSLVEFMRDVVPLLETINLSIAESTNKMPQAANQINNVTNATELATTEILDLVDRISNTVSSMQGKMTGVSEDSNEQLKVLEELHSLTQHDEKLNALVVHAKSIALHEAETNNFNSELGSISDDVYKITLSLQVQDITAQQLAAANHLITSVHEKLTTLVNDIERSDIDKELRLTMSEIPENVHFDPNASYTKDGVRQLHADEIFNTQNDTKASQEEIDKLFS